MSATEPVGAETSPKQDIEVKPAEAREHLGSAPEPVTRMDNRDLARKSEQLDQELKKRYAYSALIGMCIQLLISNGVFVGYAFGVRWQIPANVMDVWLGATVVQLIGVVALITRYLFPQRSG